MHVAALHLPVYVSSPPCWLDSLTFFLSRKINLLVLTRPLRNVPFPPTYCPCVPAKNVRTLFGSISSPISPFGRFLRVLIVFFGRLLSSSIHHFGRSHPALHAVWPKQPTTMPKRKQREVVNQKMALATRRRARGLNGLSNCQGK